MWTRIAVGLGATIPFAFFLGASPWAADVARSDLPEKPVADVAKTHQFHFARLRYPGGLHAGDCGSRTTFTAMRS
jgi:hypothetical protein